jgi:hypothetical protein
VTSALLLGALFPSLAAGRTWHVPAQAPVIQAGIDSAAAGDTVLVAPGTYTGAGNRDLDYGGKSIVVVSVAGAAATVIDVAAGRFDPHRGFLFASGEDPGAVLDGFTIQRGWMGVAPGGHPAVAAAGAARAHDLSGGGIKCQDARPTLRNLVIRDCASEYTGGGMSIEILAEPTVRNVIVQGCTAGFEGGGISVETASRPVVTDCVVTGNRALNGGGIACLASATIVGCVVAGNVAQRGGGLEAIYPAAPVIERTIVWGNCDGDGGGEIFVDNEASASFACSVLDPARIVTSGTGHVDYPAANVLGAPHFCFPLSCADAPVLGGDYQLQAGSPCLAAGSPCGERIGPLDAGCPQQTPVHALTWTAAKRLYRD